MEMMNARFMRETPIRQSYVSVAPKPEHFPALLEKAGDLLRQEAVGSRQ